MDVVGGGAASVDTFLYVDSVIEDGKGRVVRREVSFGGNVATALVAGSRIGAKTAFLGHLPDETSDEGMLAFLSDEGVDISNARTSALTKPISSTILVGRGGTRFIAFDDSTEVGLPIDLDLDLVRSARVLLVDAYGTPAGVRAATAARNAGVAVVADIERVQDPRMRELFDLTDHLILPLPTALAWTGTNQPQDAVRALWRDDRSAVVVTAGSQGCWFRAADDQCIDSVTLYPSISVEVVDTTGCGDVFHGTYAAALALGATVADSIAAATAASAECATHPGGISPRPSSLQAPAPSE